MGDDSATATGGTGQFYIGVDDCRKATCPRKQEFPKGDSPYCIIHGLERFLSEERSVQPGTE